jgi:hypothetical protein
MSRGRCGRVNIVLQGKRFVLWLFGALLIVSILFMIGTAALAHGKADVCRGYYDPQQQAACAATATVGPPPGMVKYH